MKNIPRVGFRNSVSLSSGSIFYLLLIFCAFSVDCLTDFIYTYPLSNIMVLAGVCSAESWCVAATVAVGPRAEMQEETYAVIV